jgi:hypothetical protein
MRKFVLFREDGVKGELTKATELIEKMFVPSKLKTNAGQKERPTFKLLVRR